MIKTTGKGPDFGKWLDDNIGELKLMYGPKLTWREAGQAFSDAHFGADKKEQPSLIRQFRENQEAWNARLREVAEQNESDYTSMSFTENLLRLKMGETLRFQSPVGHEWSALRIPGGFLYRNLNASTSPPVFVPFEPQEGGPIQ